MSILDIWAHIVRPSPSSAARILAQQGNEQRRQKKLEVTRRMREELGLPKHEALQ